MEMVENGELLVLVMKEEGKGYESIYLTDDINKANKTKDEMQNDFLDVIITKKVS